MFLEQDEHEKLNNTNFYAWSLIRQNKNSLTHVPTYK